MKVLIVEDVPALRAHAQEVVRRIFSPCEVSEAVNGVEGVEKALATAPDFIIMDVSMPELSGIKAAQKIWQHSPQRKILFWSQYHREAYVRELGKIVPDDAIHGYLLKSEGDDKLEEAIRSICEDENPWIDPVVRGVQARLLAKDGSLSDVEIETLVDITIGLTDKAIAQRRHISVRGVQNRLKMLLEKLVKGEEAHLRESAGMEIFNPRTRVVFAALKRGLVDPDEVRKLEDDLTEWIEEEFDFERADK